LVQQLENNILVPRIIGDSLDLNPIIVMFAVLMFGSIAGIMGMILAAPVTASIKLVGGYAWRKLFDLTPFPNPEKELEPSAPEVIIKRGREMISDLKKPEADKPKN
jgi:predicted PurR-regulated permease PerM